MVRRSWRHVALGIVLLALIVVVGHGRLRGCSASACSMRPTRPSPRSRRSGSARSSRSARPGKVFTIVAHPRRRRHGAVHVDVWRAAGRRGLASDSSMERRRMDKHDRSTSGTTSSCADGAGSVEPIAEQLATAGEEVVVVDNDRRAARRHRPHPSVVGDAIRRRRPARRPGIERARSLVAAVATDADEPLRHAVRAGRSTRPVHRGPGPARRTASRSCRRPAPTASSTRRSSAAPAWPRSCVQPHVAEFVDVVMHDREIGAAARGARDRRRLSSRQHHRRPGPRPRSDRRAHPRDTAILTVDSSQARAPARRWSPATCSSRLARRASSPPWKPRRAARERPHRPRPRSSGR